MWDSGARGASGLTVLVRLGGGSYRSAFEMLADSSRVQQVQVTQEELRRVLEAVGPEPRFGEDMTFDIAGHGSRISFRHLGPAAVIQIIRPKGIPP